MGFVYFGFDGFNQYLKEEKSSTKNPVVFSTVQLDNKSHFIRNIYLGWSSLFYLTEDRSLIHSGFTSGKTESAFCTLDCEVDNVICGWKATYIITKTGRCLYWNDNDYTSLPVPLSNQSESIFAENIAIGDLYSVMLATDGSLFSLCNDKIERLPFTSIVKSVCCGKEHVLCLTEDLKVYSFGHGSRGQLGHGTVENEDNPRVIEALEGIAIKTIAAGSWHSAAVSTIGDIYIWGWNESGQLGLPCSNLKKNQSDVIILQAIPKLLDFPNDAIIKTIACGSRHTAAITEDGQLWTWGWNGWNQLGLNEQTSVDYPVCVQFPSEYKVQDITCQYWSTLVICMIQQ